MEWLEFLSGKWDTEFRTAENGVWQEPRKSRIELKLVAGKMAVTATDENWVVTSGWDPGKQAIVTFVIGAGEWVVRAEMPEITKTRLNGKMTMTLPDGTERQSSRTWERVDDNKIIRTAVREQDGQKWEEKTTWTRVQ